MTPTLRRYLFDSGQHWLLLKPMVRAVRMALDPEVLHIG